MQKNTVEITLKLDDKVSKAYRRVSNSVQKQNKKIDSSLTSLTKRFGPMIAGLVGVTAGLTAVGKGIRFVTERSRAFESSLSKVKAILKPTQKEFRTLSDRAKELGRTTSFSASQAADAFVELGKLGLTANQILAASADVLNLAAAAQTDMAIAATATAEVLAQFGLPATEATRVVDVMAKSFTTSALDMDKFSESMKFVGATASQMGVPLESTTAALAALASQGISGSMAGTALRRVMLDLFDPTSKAGKIIELTANDTRTLSERLEVLQSKNLSTARIKNTFGLLATTSAAILIKGAQNVKKFDDILNDAEGTAKQMADTMLDNVVGATKILESAQEGLALALGESFGKGTQSRITAVTEDISELTVMVERFSERFEKLGNAWNKIVSFFSGAGVKAVRDFLEIWIVIEKKVKKYNIAMLNAEIATLKFFNSIKGVLGFSAFTDGVDDANKKLKIMKQELADIEKDHHDLIFGTGGKSKVEETTTKVIEKELVKLKGKPTATGSSAAATGGKGKVVDLQEVMRRAAQKRVALQFEIDEMILGAQAAGQKKEISQAEFAFRKKTNIILNEAAKSSEFVEAARELHQQKLTEIDKKWQDKRKQQDMDIIAFSISGAQRLTSSLAGLARVQGQAEIKKAQAAGKTEEQIQSIRKKSFEQEKRFASASAIMSTAMAVTKALATGPPHGTALAILAGITGAIQLAAINAQKFASGGVVPGTGNRDTVPAMLTPGEVVLNKEQQRALLNGGGGRSISIENVTITVGGGGNAQEIATTVQERLLELSDMNTELEALQVT